MPKKKKQEQRPSKNTLLALMETIIKMGEDIMTKEGTEHMKSAGIEVANRIAQEMKRLEIESGNKLGDKEYLLSVTVSCYGTGVQDGLKLVGKLIGDYLNAEAAYEAKSTITPYKFAWKEDIN